MKKLLLCFALLFASHSAFAQTRLNPKQLPANCEAVSNITSNGVLTKTGTGTAVTRTITGTTNEITVTNGNGVSGNPIISVPDGFYTDNIINNEKAQVLQAVYSAMSNATNIKGLWVYDETGATTNIIDRSTVSHNMTLSANASTLTPSVDGFCRNLSFSNISPTYWSVADHADFSFGNGTTDSAFSMFALVKISDATKSTIAGKLDQTTGTTHKEYLFYTDSSDMLTMNLYDDSSGGMIGRKYFTTITSDEGTWTTYCATYSGTGTSSGIKIYRNAVRVDDTDNNSGIYTAMEDKGQALASYYLSTLGITTGVFNGSVGMLLIVGEELSATRVKRLDMLTRGYIGDDLIP